MTDFYPNAEKDKAKVGDVYLEKEKAVFTIVIDVAGESTDNTIVGCELCLNVDSKTLKSSYASNWVCRAKDSFIMIGKIQNIYHCGQPDVWAKALKLEGMKWYEEFVDQINGEECKWSPGINCLLYARFVLDKLGLKEPKAIFTLGIIREIFLILSEIALRTHQ